MPVREPSNRGGNTIGHFPSLKMGCMVPYESSIEEDLLYLLDFLPIVQDFEVQPFTLEYYYEAKAHRYTPDALLGLVSRDLLIECKPLSQVSTPENFHKFEAARRYCADRGWEFHVITDVQLRTGYRLENVKLLTRYARHSVNPHLTALIFSVLSSVDQGRQPLSIIELARLVAPDNFQSALGSILHLAYRHKLGVPLDKTQLTPGSSVWLPSEAAPALPALPASIAPLMFTVSTGFYSSRKRRSLPPASDAPSLPF